MHADHREPERRQPPRETADDGDSVSGEISGAAQDDGADDRDQRPRNQPGDPAGRQHDHDDRGRHRHVLQMHVRERGEIMLQAWHRTAARGRDSEHVGQLLGRHPDADAGKESGQDGTGQEIGQEPEPGEPSQQQQTAGQQGDQAGQVNIQS